MNIIQTAHRRALRQVLCFSILAVAALCGVSCSSSGVPGDASSPPASSASPPPQPAEPPVSALLAKAHEAAQGLKKLAFELQLTQKLTGQHQDSNVAVNMQGRAEFGPLKLDQQVKSDIDGETYSMRAILVPGAYYMYDPDFEEWSRLSVEQTADLVKSLSDFQVNPGKAIQAVRSLGAGLETKQIGGLNKVSYEGNGAEAKAFLENVLESTLDLSGMEPKVRESIKLQNLKVELTLDSVKHWPLSYRIDSAMTVEYEAGKPSTLKQVMTGSYNKHNASEAVSVPEAAKKAPEPDPPAKEPQATATVG